MRKICVVTTNRADYGRLHPIMDALCKRGDIELQVVVGSAVYFHSLWKFFTYARPANLWRSLPWYLRARLIGLFGGDRGIAMRDHLSRAILADGFTIAAHVPLMLEGGTLDIMPKTAGLGLLDLPDIFEKLAPDLVLINGDRFEIMPVAVAAAFMNIRIAHVEGGDVSGTIDNSIRHAVSKLSHLHFPATKESAERLRRMGEDPATIYTFGSPIIDSLKGIDTNLDDSIFDRYPSDVGRIDLSKPYALVIQHPVTTEYADNYRQTTELLAALKDSGLQLFFVAPNIDAGSDGVTEALREFRATADQTKVVFHKHMSLEDYTKLLAHATVAVGNSSSLIREAAYLGTPVVLAGTRQQHRERGENVLEVPADRKAIAHAIEIQRTHGRYATDLRFGDGTAVPRIAEVLATIDLAQVPVQKYFYE